MQQMNNNDDNKLDISARKNEEKKKEITAIFQIFLSSLLYGISFVYQRYAMLRGIRPITFNACRFPISTILTIIAQYLIQPKMKLSQHADLISYANNRIIYDTCKWGIFVGVFVFFGSALQQMSLQYLISAKMSFITHTYVIFVPIVEWLLPGFGMNLTWKIWSSAIVSLIGMFFLSGCSTINCFEIQEKLIIYGEILVVISMFIWVLVLIATDIASKKVDCMSLAIVEDIICSVLSIMAAILLEEDMFIFPYKVIIDSWDIVLIVAIVEGTAVVLGIVGQKYINPSLTALISSSASVYTTIGGYLFLKESLNSFELLGCMLILSATLFAANQNHIEIDSINNIAIDRTLYGSI